MHARVQSQLRPNRQAPAYQIKIEVVTRLSVQAGADPSVCGLPKKDTHTQETGSVPFGSERSFAAQNTLAQDDIKLHHYRQIGLRTLKYFCYPEHLRIEASRQAKKARF